MSKRFILIICILIAVTGFFSGVLYQVERQKSVYNEYTELEHNYILLGMEKNKVQDYFNALVFEYNIIKDRYEKLLEENE